MVEKVTDTAALSALQRELEVMRDQNNDLQIQIEFLKKFSDEQRANHEKDLTEKAIFEQQKALEVSVLNQQLKTKQDELQAL